MTFGYSDSDKPAKIEEIDEITQEESYDPSTRKTLLFSVILFSTSMIAGFLLGFHPLFTEGQGSDEFMSGFSEMFPGLAELTSSELAAFILVNNAVKSLAFMILGVVLGILPAFFLVLNGGLIGLVVNISSIAISPSFIIAALVPHGIFEIPAILYASALGFKVGSQVWRKYRKRTSFVKKSLTIGLKSYLKVVLPMLILAAVIEAFVTPWFIALAIDL
ncbi:MAG: stage II sporulation protein M [Nitrososphaerales archaeon]